MKISLSTHLFVYEKLSENHILLVNNNNINAIELWCMNPHFDFHKWQEIKNLSNLVEKYQITLSSIHTPFYRNLDELYSKKTFSITSKDIQERKIALDEIALSVKVAADLGAPYAVIHAGNNTDESSPELKTILINSLEKLLTEANKLNITLALENVVSSLSNSSELVSIMKNFSSKYLAICLDTGHAFLNNELPKSIESQGSYLKTTHIHDNNGEKDEHLFPFSGKIEWMNLLKAFKKINYQGYWVLEPRKYEYSYEKHFEELNKSVSKLRELSNG